MSIRTVFSDDKDNEMDCYINTEGKVYIRIGQLDDSYMYSGYITLDKYDVQELIKILSALEQQMED